jgi:D-alanyl-D-alanine carboxypeptidase
MNKKLVIAIITAAIVVTASAGALVMLGHKKPAPVRHHKAAVVAKPVVIQPAIQPVPAPAAFNKQLHSINDPVSFWVVVNKARILQPPTYTPGDLVVPNVSLRAGISGDERYVSKQIAGSLEALVAAASKDGVTLNLQSGYRSYGFQVNLYNNYVARDGQAAADTYSARPGHSEHQTGFAVDLGGVTRPSCNVAPCFGDTPEGQWIAAHADTYGFIVRYTTAKQPVTGFEGEPWHLRYVGTELAAEMHKQGITTLEEFFGLPAAPSYVE